MAGDFYGLKTGSLENGLLRVEFLAEAGPRIVRLQQSGSDENLLAELPDMRKETPFGDYFFRGGHRLWRAPENFPLSYLPDDAGLVAEPLPDGVRLRQPTEAPTGIQKSIAVRLDPARPVLTLHHVLQNNGAEPVEAAPWAITQLPLGGSVVLPLPADSMDKEGLLPNRNLVLWPYTEWDDPRLKRADDYMLVQAEPGRVPFKVGYLNHAGWMGYVRNGILFLKRFEALVHEPHADLFCNSEVYSCDKFTELETLGPLGWLGPGQAVQHTEIWELYTGLGRTLDLSRIRALARSFGLTR